jgi:hypothetical protein
VAYEKLIRAKKSAKIIYTRHINVLIIAFSKVHREKAGHALSPLKWGES